MAAGFEGPDGKVNPRAVRMSAQHRAAYHYLSRWRIDGDQQAADATCARFGHRARAGLCDICGRGVTAEEVRASRGGR